jgi:hypothetical protein
MREMEDSKSVPIGSAVGQIEPPVLIGSHKQSEKYKRLKLGSGQTYDHSSD